MKEKENPYELARGLIIGVITTAGIFLTMFIWEILIDLINWGFPDNSIRILFIIAFLLVSGYYIIQIYLILFDKAIRKRFEIFPIETMKGNFFKKY